MTTTSEVVLIGRNSIVREGLRHLLSQHGREVICTESCLEQFQGANFASSDFLLLLIEDKQSEWDGDVLAAAHEHWPKARIAILANDFDLPAMQAAFRAGAEGYITSDLSWERLLGYLDLIALGEKIFPSQLAQKLIEDSDACCPARDAATVQSTNLSVRELQILRRLVVGSPNKVISKQLSISEATVKVHVKAVLRKLGVANRTQAAIWAAARGLQGLGADEAATSPTTLPRHDDDARSIDAIAMPAEPRIAGGRSAGNYAMRP